MRPREYCLHANSAFPEKEVIGYCLCMFNDHVYMYTLTSLVPRLPVFFFIITNKFHYSVANGGNKENLDTCNFKKTGSLVSEVLIT